MGKIDIGGPGSHSPGHSPSPVDAAGLDRLVAHFTGASFGLATRSDMVQALKSRGFRAVKARNFHQDVWCITGAKPRSK